MRKIKQTGMFVLGIALVVAFLPVSTYAQTVTEEPVTEKRCTMAKERIATRITAISTLQTERAAKFATITDRVTAFIASATEAGYPNVDKLTEARNNVRKAITARADHVSTYKTALEKTQSIICSETPAQFGLALGKAKSELVAVRESSQSVKNAIKEEAVPALREYAAWLKTNSAATKEDS